MKKRYQEVSSYLIAVTIVLIGIALQFSAREYLGAKPYLILEPAIFFAALFGGFGPGLVATVVAAIYACSSFLISETFSLSAQGMEILTYTFLFCRASFLVTAAAVTEKPTGKHWMRKYRCKLLSTSAFRAKTGFV